MLPEIRAAFAEAGVADLLLTGAPGSESELASQAIASGFTTIVSVGGDGTSSNVANSIIRAGRDTRLAIVPVGTGNDFAKTLGTLALDVRMTARLSTRRTETRVDAGLIEDTYFLNSCGFGFDVAVLEATSASRWLRGNLLYVMTALQKILLYRGAELALDDHEAAQHMMLVIANSPHFGGAFTIAPGASVVDGQLDAISIRDVALLRRIALLRAVTRGTHKSFREVGTTRAAQFTIRFAAAPRYQVDGELRLARSSTVSVYCAPSVLRVLAAPSGLVRADAP